MRVLVAWANHSSVNLGVRALAQGSADLLSSVWPDAEFTFMNYGERPAAVPWAPRSLLRERLSGKLGMMHWLRDFDLVWDTRSGDSFADIYGMTRHTTMSLLSAFAVQAGVPLVLAPQTIGPFRTRRGRALARGTLRRSALVFARDPQSAQAAASLGRPVDETTSDLVFGIAPPEPGPARDVLLNVSGLLWAENPHVNAAEYRAAIHRIIDGLLADGREVTLFPHVLASANHDNDEPVARALVEEYDGRLDLHTPTGLDDARSTIAGSRLVIGARMHACLNALSLGIPAIAMAYSRKFAPLLDSVGWDRVVSLTEAAIDPDAVLAHAAASDLPAAAAAAQDAGRRLLAPATTRLARIR